MPDKNFMSFFMGELKKEVLAPVEEGLKDAASSELN